MPRILLADIHTVDMQAVCPSRTPPDKLARPMFCPWIVTLTPPVPAIFILLKVLVTPSENDKTADTLPTCRPTVARTRMLIIDPSPTPTRLVNELSDIHLLASHPEEPVRPPIEVVTRPNPVPTSVENTLPVTG